MNEYDLAAAFKSIEDELISSMIRNMKRHRVEEIKESKQWAMWQAEQLKSLERYKQQNRKRYSAQFQEMNREIENLIRQAKSTGSMTQELRILQAIRRGYKGIGRNRSKASTSVTAEFFKLNERKLNALIEATVHDMEKAETAVLRMANDQYRKTIFNAQVYANTGAGTYEKAVDMATKDMLSRGLNCVEYANGARHTLSDYADMAIRTASKRAYLQGEGEKRQEWGIATVIMAKRGNPCPKCLPFVGKILIDDVWSGGKASDGPYPLMSTAIAAGLYHPRCKDSHSTYFPGISTADDTWTEKELAEIDQQSKEDTRQQYAARQAERFSRLAEYSLDADNRKIYQKRGMTWKQSMGERYERFNEQYLAKDINELLPSHESVVIDENKITGYALNREHPIGRNKAIAFEHKLGYTVNNKDDLIREVKKNLSKYKCTRRPETHYGQPYEVAMLIKGANGKYAEVKTGWIIDKGSSNPRLVTIYIDE